MALKVAADWYTGVNLMTVAIHTAALTLLFAALCVVGAFTNWGVPMGVSASEKKMFKSNLSDLIIGNSPTFQKTLRLGSLYFSGVCLFMAYRYLRHLRVEQYTWKTNPIPFISCVTYWIVLALISFFIWLRGKRMANQY